jgi:protein-disulfide isomerase
MNKLTVPVSERDHMQGSDSARVTLVEYGDYECPYCGAAYPIVKRIQKTMEGDLCFVFRNFPLTETHPHALHAAYAAEAAALQDKFWEMHDLLFENQDALEDDDFLRYAQQLELDTDQFMRDFSSDEVANKVEQDSSSGVRSGVNGTPTFFINGLRYDGSYEYSALLAALREELAQGQPPKPVEQRRGRARQPVRVKGR